MSLMNCKWLMSVPLCASMVYAQTAVETVVESSRQIPSDAALLGTILALAVALVVITIRFNAQRRRLEESLRLVEQRLEQYIKKVESKRKR